MPPEFLQWCAVYGVDTTNLTDQQLQGLFAEWQQLQAGDGPPEPPPEPVPTPDPPAPTPEPVSPPAPAPTPDPAPVGPINTQAAIAEMRTAMAAERQRQVDVMDICARYDSPTITIAQVQHDLATYALAQGWDNDRTELEALRASRPAAPGATTTSRNDTVNVNAITGGLMMRCGVDLDADFTGMDAREMRLPSWMRAGINDDTRQQTMDAAHQMRTRSLVDICSMALEISGAQNVPLDREEMIQAAFSSGSLATIFNNTIGARVLQSFREIADPTASFTRRVSVPDFEEHKRIKMESLQGLQYNPPGMPAEMARRTAHGEIVQAGRYSLQYPIDEQDIMGDRLGLLQDTPQDMGLAAARLIPELVFIAILSNPMMKRTGRPAFNEQDGTLIASAPLNRANVKKAIALLRRQKDGKTPINLTPTHAITGTELGDTAFELFTSAIIGEDGGQGQRNALVRYGATAISDARFGTGVYDKKEKQLVDGSETDTLLLSNNGPGIEVQTVDGTGGIPRVRVTALQQGKWGMHVDVKHDAGAAIVDNRTMVWMKEAA
ncbi:MAG: hypothetical protein AAFP90_14720 [Planctomycetota bacterium]